MNSLIVISSYPKKQSVHGKTTVGVASYAKNTLLAIKSIAPKGTDITVLADHLSDGVSHIHRGIKVKRMWKRGSVLIFFKLLGELLRNHKQTKTVAIEFELAMFGGIVHLIPLPLFLVALRLIGKKVIFINHQVISNIQEIGPHINIYEHSFRSIFYTLGLRIFYTTVLLASSKVIVFEDTLKTRLSAFGNTRKIKVIPHGVETFNHLPSKAESRKRLSLPPSEFVIISFGYLAWYKGTDWLVYAIGEIQKTLHNKKIRLILAGGPNPNHLDRKHYILYLEKLQKTAEKNNVIVTGFIDQKDIPLYYQAADVIVLPYRTFMSASGPLSFAFSFKKPFLLSSTLRGVLNHGDIQKVLTTLRISENTIVFKPNVQSFKKALSNVRNKKQVKKKLSTLSSHLSRQRNWNVIGRNYYEELFN